MMHGVKSLAALGVLGGAAAFAGFQLVKSIKSFKQACSASSIMHTIDSESAARPSSFAALRIELPLVDDGSFESASAEAPSIPDDEGATFDFSPGQSPRLPPITFNTISFISPAESEVVASRSCSTNSSTSSSPPRPASPEPAEAVSAPARDVPPAQQEGGGGEVEAALRHELAAARRHARKLQGSLAKAQQDNRVLQASSRRHLSLYKDLKAYLAKLPWATEADAAFHEEQAYIYRKEAEAARVTEQWFRHLLPPCGPDAF